MTSTLESHVREYLCREADRVQVRDSLNDIEGGITLVPFAVDGQRPRRMLPVLGAAASILFVVGMVIARHEAPREQPTAGFTESRAATSTDSTPAASATTLPIALSTTLPPTTLPPISSPPPATLASVPLPAGARLQGVSPSCTTTDSIVYDCTIAAYPEDGKAPDMTGYTTIIVDDTSHVSGGCRSVSVDATRFTCYVGQRAIDEDIVSAGYLGDWAPQGYIAG